MKKEKAERKEENKLNEFIEDNVKILKDVDETIKESKEGIGKRSR